VQQQQWTMNQDLGYGLWKVLAYDEPDRGTAQDSKCAAWLSKLARNVNWYSWFCRRSLRGSLRHRTGDLRKNRVDVGTDQADRTNHDHENNSQHHGILCDILPVIVGPQLGKEEGHVGTNLE
jgi:hypothetical protein